MKNTGICLVVVAAMTLVLAGCNRESADWKSATTADTTESYQQFLQQHSDSTHAEQARARLKALMEDHDWQTAAAADTRSAYDQFIALHPDSKWAQEARIRNENFAQNGAGPANSATEPGATMADAPEGAPAQAAAAPSAKTTPSHASIAHASTIEAPPAAHKGAPTVADTRRAETAHASAAAASAHGSYVQLGAFHSKEQAQSQWKHLAARFPTELRSLKPDYVEGQSKHGTLFRLRVPMSSVTAAKGLCGTLKKHAQSCVPLTV